jgi:hypothetical protein
MGNKIICCFSLIVLFILGTASSVAASDDSILEGESVHEMQIMYIFQSNYIANCSIEMQGKYYAAGDFYLGWYLPVQFIAPGSKVQSDTEMIDSDFHAKLMGVAGYTADKRYFACDCSIMAGWHYWYTKSSVHNSTYDLYGSYESTTTDFELGVQTTLRWKLGQTFGFQNLSNLNIDIYGYLPVTDDYYKSGSQSELAIGMSYGF